LVGRSMSVADFNDQPACSGVECQPCNREASRRSSRTRWSMVWSLMPSHSVRKSLPQDVPSNARPYRTNSPFHQQPTTQFPFRQSGNSQLVQTPDYSSYPHPVRYTDSEIPIGGVLCESTFCGFWRSCWCVRRQFPAGHRIK
jgi:hypothetical protein